MAEIIKVNRKWLIWVRKSLKYNISDISEKLRVKEETMIEWEKTGQIPYHKLEELAHWYDVNSLLFLTDEEPPSITEEVPDFRTEKNRKPKVTPEILKRIRRAKNNRQILLDISEELEISYPLTNKLQSNEKKDYISYINNKFNINKAILQEYDINKWIECFENIGILVFQFYDIYPQDIRGYAFYNEYLPIIGINHQDSPKAKIFTLFHEYVHILSGKDGISGDYYTEPEEVFCNRITAEILLPEVGLKKLWNNLNYSLENNVKIIQKNYNISKTAIIYRLLNLKLISNHEMDNYFKNVLNINKSEHKKNKNKNKESKQQHIKNKGLATEAINKNGLMYINTLLEAKDEGIITDIELARNLNITFNLIPYIQEKIGGEE